MIRMVRRADLPQACFTAENVEACTAFVGQVLTCDCLAAEAGWRLEARAQFIPVMYLTGGTHVRHEQEHINDVRQSLSGYLAAIEEMRFVSAGDCERAAHRQRAGFTRLMDRFKLDSNQLRHPLQITASRRSNGTR